MGNDRVPIASPEDLDKALERHRAVQRLKSGCSYRDVAREFNCSEAKIRRWEKWEATRGGGVEAFRDRPRGGAGKRRAITDPRLLEHIRLHGSHAITNSGIATHNHTRFVHRRAILFAATHGLRKPSESAVRRVLQEFFPRAEREYLRGGAEGYMKNIAPKPRADRADSADHILAFDNHLLDLFLRDRGRVARWWLTLGVHVQSGTVWGYVLAPRYDQMTFGLCLLRCLSPKPEDPQGLFSGLPEGLSILTDRGKDFVGNDAETFMAELGIPHQLRTAHWPWVNPVESVNSTLVRRSFRYLLGFCGSSPKNRPPKVKALLTPEELEELLPGILYVDFNTREMDRRTTHGQRITPLDRLKSLGVPMRRPVPEQLRLKLLKRATRKVGRDGIRFGGIFVFEHPLLFPLAEGGEQVEIRWDPRDMGGVHVFHKNRYVCYAVDGRAKDAKATLLDWRTRLAYRSRRQAALRDTMSPLLKAADRGRQYLDELKAMRAIPAEVGAAAGSRRRGMPMLLGQEAQAEPYDPWKLKNKK